MSIAEGKLNEGVLTIKLVGHIDSSNASVAEEEVNAAVESAPGAEIVLDAEELKYISSVGLRMILKLRKAHPTLKVINVVPEVYEIFDMTGFTEMMTIEKAYRRVSVEGCEVIGEGANGKVYRLDPDTIIKVYKSPDSLDDIHRERELARAAFVKGIPTAIPYDVVKVGESYGSVFELLNATSFAKLMIREPERFDKTVDEYVELLKTLHSTEVAPNEMPDSLPVAKDWATRLRGRIPDDQADKLIRLVDELPVKHTIVHGDYHIKNVMLQNGEALLIDMDTLSYGHPIIEFTGIFQAYVGFSSVDHEVVKKFIGIDFDSATHLWEETVKRYFGTKTEEEFRHYEDKLKLLSYARILGRAYKKDRDNIPMIDFCTKQIAELIDRVDSLDF